jgi:hypothetical protein
VIPNSLQAIIPNLQSFQFAAPRPYCCGEVGSCIGCVFKVSRLVVFYVRDTPPIPCQNVALANAAQFSSPALLPRCLVALLPRCLVTLLPCCLVAVLPCCLCYLITLLAALWGSRAALYNDCSQLRTSNLLFSSSTTYHRHPYLPILHKSQQQIVIDIPVRYILSYLISFPQSILLIFARSSSTADTHEALPEVIMAQDNTLA